MGLVSVGQGLPPAFFQSLPALVEYGAPRVKRNYNESFKEECQLADGTEVDCTMACNNSTLLFGSKANLYNCVVMTAEAMKLEDQNSKLGGTKAEDQESSQTSPLAEFEWDNVLSSISTCYAATCTTGSYGSCQDPLGGSEEVEEARTVAAMTALTGFVKGLDTLCPERDNTYEEHPQGSITGPGVLAAYFLQLGLALWFFFFGNILGYWSDMAGAVLIYFARKRQSSTIIDLEKRTALFLYRLRDSQVAGAVFSSMNEFQETQAFFIISIQIATFISYRPLSWNPEEFVDARAAAFFATVQVLPVIMTQSSMQRAGMYWHYPLFLTTAVYVMGVVIDRVILSAHDVQPLEQCGGNESVLPSCLSPRTNNTVHGRYGCDFARAVVGMTHFAFALIVVDNLMHTLIRSQVIRAGQLSVKTVKIVRSIWHLRWVVFDIVLLVFLIKYLTTINKQAERSFSEKGGWVYGQVTVVLLWLPVIVKYIHYSIFGVESGVERRLDPHLKVNMRNSYIEDEKHPEFDVQWEEAPRQRRGPMPYFEAP